MRSVWKLLKLPLDESSVPPLIVKYEVGTSDYTVWVSDLTLIWKESLDRKRIIRRSLDVDTSIDPSEDSEQLRLFLFRVCEALEQRPGTSLDLVQNGSGQSLSLRTFTPLPGSLKPLEWPIELLPASQSTLTAELIVPMLSQQVLARAEKASLLQHLKEKDQIMAKFADRMQADGIDLGKLFPGVTSKSSKPMSRQALGKSVKGLGEFDEHIWQMNLTKSISSPGAFVDLVSGLLDPGSGEELDPVHMPEYKNWWETLNQKRSQPMAPFGESNHSVLGETSMQDEVKKQSTVPMPTRESKAKSTKLEDADVENIEQSQSSDSTTDESDEDLQSAPPVHETASNPPLKASLVPSVIQSNKALKDEADRGITPNPKANSHGDNSSASDTEDSQAESKPVISRTPNKSSALKPRANLGKIGGKGKVNNDSGVHPPVSHEQPVMAGNASSTSVTSLNQVGGVTKTRPESGRGDRANSRPRAPTPPRESSQERANRNREKLKRELEIKGQSGAKKKRRF